MTKMRKSSRTRIWRIAAVAAVSVTVGAVGALADVNAAQTMTAPKLARRLDADEVQARALATHIQAMQQKSGYVRTAALFGESDEEKAARLAKRNRGRMAEDAAAIAEAAGETEPPKPVTTQRQQPVGKNRAKKQGPKK